MTTNSQKANKTLTPEEKWESLTLANNFIFYKVMRQHPDACRRLLEMLLGIKIESMQINAEETIALDYDSKGIRLDVFENGLPICTFENLFYKVPHGGGIKQVDRKNFGRKFLPRHGCREALLFCASVC